MQTARQGPPPQGNRLNRLTSAHLGRSVLSAFLTSIAVAVAAVGIVPTAGAATGTLSYSCSGDGFGEPGTAHTVQAVVDSDLPTTLPFGSTVAANWTTRVVVPESIGDWARAKGFATLYASVDVFDVVAAPTTTVLKGEGSMATAKVAAQRVVPTDPSTQASSAGTATYPVPRVKTTTSGVSAPVSDSGVLRVRARVVARDESDVTGRVAFSVKRNGRTIHNATVSVRRGEVAKTKFRGVAPRGRYVMLASYLGDNTFEPSRRSLRFTLR